MTGYAAAGEHVLGRRAVRRVPAVLSTAREHAAHRN
jgi:hypothetical protein